MISIVKKYFSKLSAYIIITLVTLMVSWPSLLNDFSALDDNAQVVQNLDIRSLDYQNISKIFSSLYIGMYQPLATLSFALEFHFFGINPVTMHGDNIILHIINACLAYYFIYLLTRRKPLALIIGIVFSIHPVQTETVAWISARSNLLMTFFYLLTLIVYLKYITKPNISKYLILIILFLLALLSKAPAITLPLTLILIDWFHKRLNPKALAEKFILVVMSIIFIAITLIGKVNAYSFDPSDYNIFSRLTLIPYSLGKYLLNFIAPYKLLALYAYPSANNGWLEPVVYLSGLVLVLIIFLLWHYRHRRLLVFGSIFFLCAVITQLPFIPANQTIIADRYLYLAIVGLSLALADLYDWLSQNHDIRFSLRLILISAIIMVFMSVSWMRYQDWGDDVFLLQQSALAAPHSGIAHFHAAHAFLKAQDYVSALAYNDRSIELDPDNAYAQVLSARILVVHFQDYQPALTRFNKTIQRFSTCALCYYGRAHCLTQIKDYSNALNDLDLAQKYNTNDTSLGFDIELGRAIILKEMGQPESACKALKSALLINPSFQSEDWKQYCHD